MPKKKNRRSSAEHPDLDPRYNLKTRYDLYDQDYIHKLSPKERNWLNKFNKEYIGASLDKDHPKRNLHKTKALKKDCYDRNNSRNRDVLTREKATKRILDIQDLNETAEKDNQEDFLIQELDKQEARKAIDWLAEELKKDEEKLEDRLIDEVEAKQPQRRK